MKKLFFILVVGIAILLLGKSVVAVDQVKTIEQFVTASDIQISSATSTPFSIYIGDNISGVSSPIKSAYFVISGVYTSTGSPTLQVRLNGDSNSLKTFNLPNVGSTPEPFEILYRDNSNIINPSSAGTYNYTLDITPSNMTISGLGGKAMVSYRYKPPTCGAGLPATGELISPVFDTTANADGPSYNSILWKGNLGGAGQNEGRVRFQLTTSNSASGPWNFFGSSDGGVTCNSTSWYDPGAQDSPIEISCAPSQHNNQRYFKYKIQLCSNDCSTSGTNTPTVNDVVVNWSP